MLVGNLSLKVCAVWVLCGDEAAGDDGLGDALEDIGVEGVWEGGGEGEEEGYESDKKFHCEGLKVDVVPMRV